jgi:hypothetical protein
MEADMNNLKALISPTLLFTSLAVGLCAAPGCKSHGNSELLERELRCQEDRIYQLEDELDEACYALESSRRENEALKKELAGGDKGAGGRFAPSASGGLPKILTPAIPEVDVPDLDALPVETPAEAAPRYLPRSSKSPDLEEAPPYKPMKFSTPILGDDEDGEKLQSPALKGKPLTGDANAVTKLVINRQLTGGWNADGHHGDEGVFVAFEPRDANNKLVEAAGDISIVILDPSQTGAAARVARWDYVADEAEMHFRTGPIGRGFQFELPWPSNPPKNRELRLFLRYSKTNGVQIETDAKIRVTPYDNWTAKEPESSEEEIAVKKPEDEGSHRQAQNTARTAELPKKSKPPEAKQPASRLTKKPRPWAPVR